MNFKIFFFLIIIALSSNSHAQWWQSGGNLIWPYGDVTLSNGRLLVKDSDTTTSSIWSDTQSSIFARGNRSSWWGVIQAEAIGVDGDDPTIPLYGIKGHTTSYYTSGELYNGTWGGYFSNNPRLSGTATTKTNFNFPTNSVTGVLGEIAVNSHTQVDLDITCGVGAYLIAYQMENDITNYLGFGSTGWIAESDSFSVENYFSYYSRPALLLKDITNYYAYYSDDLYPGTNISKFYHFYGKGDHPSYFGGDIQSAGSFISSDYEVILLRFDKNSDDQEFNLEIYRNDTGATIDTFYWSNGTYGINHFLEFSSDIVNASTQQVFYSAGVNNAYNSTTFVPSVCQVQRSGQDNRLNISFIDNSGNAIDLFSASCLITIYITPNTVIDSYSLTW